MDAERWKQIEKVFQSALEQAPEARPTFLASVCSGDQTLRLEVESLLAHQTIAGGALEAAIDDARQLFTEQQSPGIAGSRLGPYQILQQIGVGGMGEVYLAEDARLRRKVALKLLPAHFTGDRDRVRRFAQEARAASALNHPNIITIFEIGQASIEEGGAHFIATEFVDGQTLRQRLAGELLPLTEALDILIQTAGALAAAHEAGIIHRDVKPENVMLRRDGYIKVLDFGLAKLTERPKSAVEPDAPTVGIVSTEPGLVMGTVAYMSPEQARGLEVDARTDIFSLGVMSYETLAGQRPFTGATKADVISAILHAEPPPLAPHLPEAPETLEWIVAKALRKDREERYQTSKELLTDLKSLKQQLELQAGLARAGLPAMRGEEATGKARKTQPETGPVVIAGTDEMAPARTNSSAEILINEIKRHKTSASLALLALVTIIAGAGFWVYRLINQRQTPVPFHAMRLIPLTSSGKAAEAAVSPDGRYVVYALGDAGRQSIRVKQIATDSEMQIAPAAAQASYSNLTFSPDGNYVFYVKNEAGNTDSPLYKIPVVGGAARKLTDRVHGGLSFAPDGKRLAYIRWNPSRGEEARGRKQLMLINEDGSGERPLAMRLAPEQFIHPAWSPDSQTIACTVANLNDNSVTLVAVRVADGADSPLAQRWFNVGRIAWLPDGSGLILPASDKASSRPQLWHLAYPGGAVRRITNDLHSYNSASLTADATALVTVQNNQSSNIWTAPGHDANRATQITFGVSQHGAGVLLGMGSANDDEGGGGVAWTPDGKIVYHSLASGQPELWMMEADGSNQRQLTAGAGTNFYPAVSPDGRYIVFNSDRTGPINLWRMKPDGSQPTQLTNDQGQYPSCSLDGRWVAYSVTSFGNNVVWRTPMDGGAPLRVTAQNDSGVRPVVSPDGQWVACNYIPRGSDWNLRIAVLPFDGGVPARMFEIPTTNPMRELHWSADGRALTWIETREGVSNLWSQALTGGPPKQLTDFKAERIFSFAWSRDGKQLACARGTRTSDVVLISSFR